MGEANVQSLLQPACSRVASDFGKGSIKLDEIELNEVSNFAMVWSTRKRGKQNKGVAFYKPVEIPSGFFTLGYYGQPHSEPFHGWLLVAKDTTQDLSTQQSDSIPLTERTSPPLEKPLCYSQVWNSEKWKGLKAGNGYFWLPVSSEGYKAVGFLVTKTPEEPSVEEIRCIRSDLTDTCEIHDLIWDETRTMPFGVWNVRPKERRMKAQGIYAGTFYCNKSLAPEESLPVACLKNASSALNAMPNLMQVHQIINKYGPTIFFHPQEIYFPSSVSWFFEQGVLLQNKEGSLHKKIESDGSNLPQEGTNDSEYYLDLPKDKDKEKGKVEKLKHGDLQSSEVYTHIKAMLGGTFTDVVMWVFYPFNGPGTAKICGVNLPLGKLGEHVGDWEHCTLRVSNFTGELWGIYFSAHRGGQWVRAQALEYIQGKRPVVYASKYGHANFPHAGLVLQGSNKVCIGLRNDTAKSMYTLDTSSRYKIVAAEYLRSLGESDVPSEPPWLNYAREWGPKKIYEAKKLLPSIVKSSHLLPKVLSGEEGPTGPKMKDNWNGDEKC